ncbi:MAG: DUF885 family protein [Planctomycetota bacterium]
MNPLLASLPLSLFGLLPQTPATTDMAAEVRLFQADHEALSRFYDIRLSSERSLRMKAFLADRAAKLEKIDFDSLDREGKVDFVLLRSHIRHEQKELAHQELRDEESRKLLPFAGTIIRLEEDRRHMKFPDAREAADLVNGIDEAVHVVRESLEKKTEGPDGEETQSVSPVTARRAARALDALRSTFKTWFRQNDGYQPEFGWWVREPYQKAAKDLEDYAGYLRNDLAGIKDEDDDPLIGDPIGREALLDDLEAEMIPYSPEELIAIGEEQFAWCEERMKEASAELGFGDDWHKALAHVKDLYVPPGKQEDLILEQARFVIDFLDKHDLVTIPPLCRETWRLDMLSADRQRFLPFAAYGGQKMLVAYPLERMDHERKLMSMRGNNIHFSRIVTPHELIPGHHLQGFMAARQHTYRRIFSTPFLGEGWALYWEMLLWDLGYARGPEDRIGMLFWRMHRCARILVSLRFHLGEMAPEEMIDFLVERVGHEEDGATAEVRRYISGGYGPLYQCAYMIGGLQLRALHEELVGGGVMDDRGFHDAILRQNSIPVEMIRAALTEAPLSPDYRPNWKFAGEHPGR